MLRCPGVAVPDWPPPLRYALAVWPETARALEPFIAAGFSDAEAWASLFDDAHRLDVFRSVHGNRKGRRRKARESTNREAQGALL